MYNIVAVFLRPQCRTDGGDNNALGSLLSAYSGIFLHSPPVYTHQPKTLVTTNIHVNRMAMWKEGDTWKCNGWEYNRMMVMLEELNQGTKCLGLREAAQNFVWHIFNCIQYCIS
jgi:hypothetical protein